MPPITQINVTAQPRLHVTLIGMNKGGYRINGGVGFAIKDPSIKINALPSSKFEVTDLRRVKFNGSEVDRMEKTLSKIFSDLQLMNKIRVEISGDMISHVGFGSSTAIRLSCIESLLILNNRDYTDELLVSLSGRGGTSGVGINTFYRGGFIFDIGRKSTDYILRPSSLSENRKNIPLLFTSLEMPEWDIGICLPKMIPPKSEEDEKDFFERICPIEDYQVNEILYHVIYGLLASVLEKDKETFCESVKKIQNCAWKKAERDIYGEELFKIESKLYEFGATTVGMSSLGPLLFFLSDNVSVVIEKMKKHYTDCLLIKTSASNKGRTIYYG